MTRRLILVLAAAGALASAGVAYGQPTNTPTPARTPTPTPTSNRWIDLSMAKAASPNPVAVGQDLTYTLTVRNNGPNAATFGLEMADTLPADVTFVSASIEASAFGPGSCNHSSGTVRCYTPGLSPGDTRRAFIVVKPTNSGQITNSAQASVTAGSHGGNRDPDLSNNTATITTNVVAAPPTLTPSKTRTPTRTRTETPTLTPTSNRTSDFSVTMVVSPNPVRVGENLTYTLTVRNNGPSNSLGGGLRDTLPADVTFVSAAFFPGCQYGGGIVTCSFGQIFGNGESRQATIVVRPTRAGKITNFAEVSPGGEARDPFPANNTATLTSNVLPALTNTPTRTPTRTQTPTPTSTPTNVIPVFLHGGGSVANPPVLSLDGAAPTGATAKYKDSPAVQSGLTNPWVDVGTWSAQPALFAGTLDTLVDLRAWLGLKNGDDEGTQFDIRAEVWKNGVELVASGETACVRGVARPPEKAKEVSIPFDLFPPVAFDDTADVLSLRVLARIGTRCSGPNHSGATGVRLYFDSLQRPSGLGVGGPPAR